MAPRIVVPKANKDIADKTFVIDNGAYTIKAGYSSPDPQASDCTIIQNTIAHSARDRCTYVGAQLSKCTDFGELAYRRPVQKGYLVNWEAERAIWEHSFFDGDAKLKVDPRETNLILTEAPNCTEALQTNCDEMVFEYFEFASYYRCIASSLNAYNDVASIHSHTAPSPPSLPLSPPEALVIIDTSYSHTTITPLLCGNPIQPAIRRLTIGGKFMTNFLKEQASIRHFNVIDETHLLNDAKEAVAYVSSSMPDDLEATWQGGLKDSKAVIRYDPDLTLDFVLPDYETVKKGYTRPHKPTSEGKLAGRAKQAAPGNIKEDVLPLGNERFRTPELLFHPSDVGINEAGLPEALNQSLMCLPEGLRPAMCSNIVVVGGNAQISGLMDRLKRDIRAILPQEYPVRVSRAPDPIVSTWLGGARLGADRDTLIRQLVTRRDYEEMGTAYLQKRFSHRL